MATKDTKYRVGFGVMLGLTLFAIILDIIGLIPFTEDVTVWLFWAISNIVLRQCGVALFNGRKLAVMAIDILVGLIPGVQALPQITLGILAVFAIIRAEDMTGIGFIGKDGLANTEELKTTLSARFNRGGTRLPPAKTPLNQDGVRAPAPQVQVANNVVPMAQEEPEELDMAA